MPAPAPAGTPDLRFWFDPVCPFAWLTSQWVRTVRAQRGLEVEWRLISLRLLNAHLDYDTHFPADYEAGHTAGLRLLRVCARVRDAHGNDGVDSLYAALGARIHDTEPPRPPQGSAPPSTSSSKQAQGTADYLRPVLEQAGLPMVLVEALDDERLDAQIRSETDEALALTGKDVGTPILHIAPPDGAAFFGPVISRLPDDEQAAELWDHVVGLARFPGFAELKRSLREKPQLRSWGATPGDLGAQEDWHAGSRRQKKEG